LDSGSGSLIIYSELKIICLFLTQNSLQLEKILLAEENLLSIYPLINQFSKKQFQFFDFIPLKN